MRRAATRQVPGIDAAFVKKRGLRGKDGGRSWTRICTPLRKGFRPGFQVRRFDLVAAILGPLWNVEAFSWRGIPPCGTAAPVRNPDGGAVLFGQDLKQLRE
jgi:hypothetical protein